MAEDGQTDHALERLVFFSDAVFAIAITLLVIEIHVPRLPRTASDVDFLHALAELIPSFIGYAISFAVIGAFWAGHHRAFKAAHRYSPAVVTWNLFLLACVAFIPFATAFASANAGMRVPIVLYCATLLVTALLNVKVVRIATAPEMAGEDADDPAVRYVRVRSVSVVLGAATALVFSFFVPIAGQAALATIPLWRRLLTNRSLSRASRPAQTS